MNSNSSNFDAVAALTRHLERKSIKTAKDDGKKKLLPGEYEAEHGRLVASRLIVPKDAATTKVNIGLVCNKWKR
jgi:hypothetical protein